jgi:hypothetical protein
MKLNNHRQLRPNEIIKKGDVVLLDDGMTIPVYNSIGQTPALIGHIKPLSFYRRKHIKKQPAVKPPAKVTVTKANQIQIPATIVEFYYNNTLRQMQVIKMDDTYLKGLEITRRRDNSKQYQFKSFLLGRIDDPLRLIHYGPEADFKG